jgi:ribosomally synthesized peptide (two-chain TOMM family)
MSMSDMMSFRTAYLRLVALAWSDPAFRKTLPGMTSAQIKTTLAGLGHTWTWGGLDPALAVDGPVWNPVETGGWAGHGASVITLVLPLDPKNIEGFPESQASALAAYYQQRPTLFGLPPEGTTIQQSYSASLGDFAAFLDFGGITLRAVALAWRNADFRAALSRNALEALAEYFGYNCPWDLKIVVKDDSHAHWKEASGSGPSQWTSLSNNILKLDLPQPPGTVDIRAIALTAYNETGPAYPFTCCD